MLSFGSLVINIELVIYRYNLLDCGKILSCKKWIWMIWMSLLPWSGCDNQAAFHLPLHRRKLLVTIKVCSDRQWSKFASNNIFKLTLHSIVPPLKFILLFVWTHSQTGPADTHKGSPSAQQSCQMQTWPSCWQQSPTAVPSAFTTTAYWTDWLDFQRWWEVYFSSWHVGFEKMTDFSCSPMKCLRQEVSQ